MAGAQAAQAPLSSPTAKAGGAGADAGAGPVPDISAPERPLSHSSTRAACGVGVEGSLGCVRVGWGRVGGLRGSATDWAGMGESRGHQGGGGHLGSVGVVWRGRRCGHVFVRPKIRSGRLGAERAGLPTRPRPLFSFCDGSVGGTDGAVAVAVAAAGGGRRGRARLRCRCRAAVIRVRDQPSRGAGGARAGCGSPAGSLLSLWLPEQDAAP